MAAPDSLRVEAIARARRAGLDVEVMEAALLAQRRDRPFVVEIEDTTSGGQFFRVTQEGPTRVLYLNVGHPFYSTIYDPPGATAYYRAAVEIMLWILGTSALDADAEARQTYLTEIGRWSESLRVAGPILDTLLDYPAERDRIASEEED